MAASQVRSTTGVSASTPANFDTCKNSFSIGIGCVVSGTVTYTIQHTFDDIQNTAAGSCTWFDHDDSGLVGATANADGNFAFPCTAARINQTGGSGTVTATFIQAGLVGP